MTTVTSGGTDGHSMRMIAVGTSVPNGVIPVAGSDVVEAEMRVRRVVESVYRMGVLGGFFTHDTMMVRPIRAHAGAVSVTRYLINRERTK